MISPMQSHRQVWEQIPWILNGSASEADLQSAQAHLSQCADCREALAFERRLQEALQQPRTAVDGEAEEGWQRLSARIDAQSSGRASLRSRLSASNQSRWLAAAVIAEALALGAMVTSSWLTHGERAPTPVYQTLSQPDPTRPQPTIRVVLAPDMTLEQLRTLLKGAHMQVVAGPGESGVWSLAPAEDAAAVATDIALRELRGSPHVRFAEPIATAARVP
jgi:hypothetical protein